MKSSRLEWFHRHSFVWVDKDCDQLDKVVGESSSDSLEIFGNWVAQGRPLIIRRPCLSQDERFLCVGLALPPSPVKRRLAYRIPVSTISRIDEPPYWNLCNAKADFGTNNSIVAIQQTTDNLRLPLRAFGSYAWEHLTGLPYTTSSSDVDLLICIEDQQGWRHFNASMREIGRADRRIDLEIMMNRNASFNWREYEATGLRMLFKSNDAVWLGDKSQVEDFLHD